MKPIHHKTMERRRSILAGFKILATTAFLLLFLLILILVLMMAGNHFDAKLDDLQGDIGQMRWELENLRRENELLRGELEGLRQGRRNGWRGLRYETWKQRPIRMLLYRG